jgi:hypothetical protein
LREYTDIYQSEFQLDDEWKLVSCPLGDREEDIRAFNEIHGQDNPNQTKFRFYTPAEKYELWYNNQTNRQRAAVKRKKFYQVAWMVTKYYRLGGQKKLCKSIRWAMNRIGYRLNKNLMGSLTRFVEKILYSTRKKVTPTSFYIKRKRTFNSNTLKRYTTKVRNLCFALLVGRRPREGFGRLWCQNDKDWVPLSQLHWENCKVIFNERILYRTIYDLLCAGVSVADIRKQYERILLVHHGLANDKGIQFQCSGIASDLRRFFKCFRTS